MVRTVMPPPGITIHLRETPARWRRCTVQRDQRSLAGTVIGRTELAGTPTRLEIAFDDGTTQLVWPALVSVAPVPTGRPALTVVTAP